MSGTSLVSASVIKSPTGSSMCRKASARWIVSSAPSLHVPAVVCTGVHLRFRAISFS